MTFAVSSVRAEYRSDTPFVAVARPRVSWKVDTDRKGWLQAGAQIEWTPADGIAIASAIDGGQSVFVDWPFADLKPRERGQVRVRVRGEDGADSPWSAPIDVVAGFLGDDEWVAEFVALRSPRKPAQPAWFRAEFEVLGAVASATLYATAQGVYQAEINGEHVDDEVLKPGWTAYPHRLIHETTDVTGLIRPGRNAIGATVAGGWFTEQFGFAGRARRVYGEQPSFAAQLVLVYADGRTQMVATGVDWRATDTGPIVSSGIYAGERYDARHELAGWSSPGYDDQPWSGVRIADRGPVPSARCAPPVRATEELAVREVLTAPDGAVVVDFGQNLAGRLKIRVSGPAGHTITLRHAEVLENGELAVRPLRAAEATDVYTLAGHDAGEVWEPQFTFHGFRYAQIDGWPGEFDPEAVSAVVVHSDMRRTGWFESSDPLVNRLHENVLWGMRGNFLSIPTDCPQRDERLGWTGDIQVFAPTAAYLHDSAGFLASWLTDLAIEQESGGGVPFVVPDVLDTADTPAAAWGDAAAVVPWVLYERYSDIGVLRAQFPSMRAWVDQIVKVVGERRLWEGGFQFGDWLDPAAPVDRPGEAKTDAGVVATAYFFRSADVVARAAAVLNLPDLAEQYGRLAEEVRQAWLHEYTTPAGRVVSDSQTAYALAIRFGIVADHDQLTMMGERLAWLVRRDGYRIGTGFVGTPLLLDALVATGHEEAASRMLAQTECPSWLYAVTMGATTIWERWDSMLPDGTINAGEMTSFNHYAFGAIADWLHRVVAGLAPGRPGYRMLEIRPRPLIGLSAAAAEHETPYGRARASWTSDEGFVTVSVSVPPNTRASVQLPDGRDAFEVGSGSHTWTVADLRPPEDPQVVTLDSPLSDVIADPPAYDVITRVLQRDAPALAHAFRHHTRWVEDLVLRDALPPWQTEPDVIAAVEAALEELNSHRQ